MNMQTTIRPWPETHEPGIYFGMPEAEYHADPSLSASGIVNMAISPLTYWALSPLNPDNDPEASTDSQAEGKLLHARLLFGREWWEARHAVEPDPSQHPDVPRTGEQMKAAAEEFGVGKSGTLLQIAERLAEAGYPGPLWPLVMQKWEGEIGARERIKPATGRMIEWAGRMVEATPAARDAFSGGLPEVGIFWRDPESGVPMKARIDYLRPDAIADLKTFSNPRGLGLDRAVAQVVAGGRHHIQAHHYCRGLEAIKAMLRAEGLAVVHHRGETPATVEWLTKVRDAPPHRFLFVFLERAVGNVRVREMPRRGLIWDAARIAVSDAVESWARHWHAYGAEPWVSPEPAYEFADEDFPAWME